MSAYGLAEDVCPVGDELLGDLYRSHERGLADLVATVAPDVRATLALFCYRRGHLHSMGVAIAASCSEEEASSCLSEIQKSLIFKKCRRK